MKLIAGLGNPGKRYEKTRHNAGFIAIGHLLGRFGVRRMDTIGVHRIARGDVLGHDVVFFKPASYMNLSGGPVRDVMDAAGAAPEDLLVIHDDIDIAPGSVRYKTGGGHAGHNGVRSIIEEIGTGDFNRIRIGVGRPPEGMSAADYVLSEFTAEELDPLAEALEEAAGLVENRFLASGIKSG